MPSGPQSTAGHFLLAASGSIIFVRVVGLATMNNSFYLQEVLEDSRGRGFRQFTFDLARCGGFDSTFMGMLLGLAQEMAAPSAPARSACEVVVVNADSSHRKLLAGVGVDRMVQIHPEAVQFPEVELRRLEDRPDDPKRRIRAIISAHESLVRLGGPNREKFGTLLDGLKREFAADAPAKT